MHVALYKAPERHSQQLQVKNANNALGERVRQKKVKTQACGVGPAIAASVAKPLISVEKGEHLTSMWLLDVMVFFSQWFTAWLGIFVMLQ